MVSLSPTIHPLMASTLLLVLCSLVANLQPTDAQIGACYGMMGNNLPSPGEVVALYKARNIKRMRLYDPNQATLHALKGSNIELILGVPNSDLHTLSNPSNARSWVQTNILNFWPSVKFRYIAVGNEVSPIGGSSQYAPFVLPAMQNVYQALKSANLYTQIKVSTAIDTTLIGTSFPPSQGAFRPDIMSYFHPIIGFLQYANYPLLANVYTYFSYKDNPRDISLQYALFTSPKVLVWDNGKGYQNLFDAMMDSLYSALERTGQGSLQVVVSESGWPSGGGAGASFDNAGTYLSKLMQHVVKGTPKRPSPIETYLFAMFDENQKQPELEKNFGVFFPNKQAKYNLNFGGQRSWDVIDESSYNSTIVSKSDI